jgi:hypothetical protein
LRPTSAASAKAVFAESERLSDIDADTPKSNPAQEAFDKNEAQLEIYRARKNAKREALERTRLGEKSGPGEYQS